jgi:hypothetical protein
MSRQSRFNPPRYLWADVPQEPDQTVWPYAASLEQPNPPAYPAPDPTSSFFTPNARDNQSSRTNPTAALNTSQNCSLYITNLPATTTVKILLQALTRHGPFDRIYACHVTPPKQTPGFRTATAKLTTFTRGGAERLLAFINQRRLILGTLTADATWNRRFTPPPPQLPPDVTRVLIIRGPRDIVNGDALAAFFRAPPHGLRFHTQGVFFTDTAAAAERTMGWQFGSYPGQAEAARRALLCGRWAGLVEVEFGRDPCAA